MRRTGILDQPPEKLVIWSAPLLIGIICLGASPG